MQFASPALLNLVWAAPGLLLLMFFVAARRRTSLLKRLADSNLLGILVRKSTRAVAIRNALLALSAVAIAISVARPQVGSGTAVAKRKGIDLIIGIDTSLSMNARDVKPTRFEVARRAAASLVEQLGGDRVGIVIFAGTAFVQCPLTLDHAAARMFLDSIDTGSIPVPGTAIAEAIQKACEMASEQDKSSTVLVLFTDGEDHEGDVLDAAKKAAEIGMVIYTVGLGSETGEPIPVPEGEGYKRDKKGEVVMTQLNSELLTKVALATGGKFYRASQSGEELDRIVSEISEMQKKELESRVFTDYIEWFQLPLAIGVLLLMLEMAIPEVLRDGD